MLPAGQQAQHPLRIRGIHGLAKNLSVHHHDRIRSQDKVGWPLLEDGPSLLSRQALGKDLGRFSVQRRFRDIGGLHRDCDAGCAKQFLTPGRSGGEYESHRQNSSGISRTQPATNSIRFPKGSKI